MTSLESLNPDFRDIVALLCEEGADFVIVGGSAVAFHRQQQAVA
jgi:heptaprenylglyceryl phosphate synthase